MTAKVTAKVKVKSRPAASPIAEESQPEAWKTAPLTTEERLQRIQARGKRVEGYVQYMCKVGSMASTSTEAKDRAVAAFYDRFIFLERELNRIQEELQLG